MKFALLLLVAGLLASCAPSTPEARIAANPAKYESLSSKHQQLVRQGKIDTGMSPDAVALAWGSPNRRFEGRFMNCRGRASPVTWVCTRL